MSQFHSSSPPPVPLRHPVPTHPAYIPEPPSTPSSPQGYQRFSSSPGPVPPQQPLPPPHAGAGAAAAAYSSASSSSSGGNGYQPYVPAYAGAFGGAGAPTQHQQQGPGGQYGGGGGGGYNQQPQGRMAQPGVQGHMGQGGAFQPNFGAWGIDNTTAQLGMQLGQSAVAAGQDYVQKNFGTLLPQQTLKHHFNVSNSYVLSKVRLLLFPWMHKPWARRTKRVDAQSGGGANHEWCAPREDVNSPDLYIPVMAIVTYILLTGLHAGINSTKGFKPQILGESASRATLVVFFDSLFVKLGCYILNIPTLAPSSASSFAPSSQLVDIFAYTGYKFVGVIATLSAGFLGLSGLLWWAVFVYFFLGNAFFMLRSLRSLVLPDPSIAIATSSGATTATVNPAQRRRRITFLFVEACLQVVYMGALVRLG